MTFVFVFGWLDLCKKYTKCVWLVWLYIIVVGDWVLLGKVFDMVNVYFQLTEFVQKYENWSGCAFGDPVNDWNKKR